MANPEQDREPTAVETLRDRWTADDETTAALAAVGVEPATLATQAVEILESGGYLGGPTVEELDEALADVERRAAANRAVANLHVPKTVTVCAECSAPWVDGGCPTARAVAGETVLGADETAG